jgi:leucyl aminopeptidase
LTEPTPIHLVGPDTFAAFLAEGPERRRASAALAEFKAKRGSVLAVFDGEGRVAEALVGVGDAPGDAMALRGAPEKLPLGCYRIATAPAGFDAELGALAWRLGEYRYERYKAEPGRDYAELELPEGVDAAAVERVAAACELARDLVNTPPNDMGPAELAGAAALTAEGHGARISIVEGAGLVEGGYPAVHAVGQAACAERSPRMVEISWEGPGAGEGAPLVAIVGKGVAFDTGGLDIKPSAGMRLMKKDMGGAAHALALGQMVMSARLPVRLSILLPLAENAIGGAAMRPGDVLATRKGLTVEVGNTDAEGRLILADALARAAELSPDLTIDLATLTGAARAALGPEVIPFYTADDLLAGELAAAAEAVGDPLWRMPLWDGYAESLKSDIADLKNDPSPWAQAGSVTAALFLRRFAPESGAWVHFDIFAWNPRGGAGRPVGAEAQAIRALWRVLQNRYAA